MIASHVPDMLSELQAVALKVMSRIRLGIGRGISEALQLLHVRGRLHLHEVLPHGYQEVHLVLGQSVPF